MDAISEQKEQEGYIIHHYSLDVILQQRWYDFRLIHNHPDIITLSGQVVDLFWRPDTRSLAEKKSYPTEILKSNQLMRLYPNGTVVASQRCSLVNYCKMDFRAFPFDSQYCQFVLESYSYSNSYLKFDWFFKQASASFRVPADPNIEEFVFQSYKISKEEFHYGGDGSGSHDHLIVDIKLYRPVKFYIIRLYLPIILIVFLSWFSFWIDYRSVPARTTIGITTVLTFVEVRMNIFKREVPDGKELNWYDIYSQICFTFVFLALVEYSIAQSIDMKYRLSDWYRVRQDNPDDDLLDYEDTVEDNANTKADSTEDTIITTHQFKSLFSKFSFKYLDYKHSKNREKYHILDKISRIIFPVTFLFVNIIYFSVVYTHYVVSTRNIDGYTEVVRTG